MVFIETFSFLRAFFLELSYYHPKYPLVPNFMFTFKIFFKYIPPSLAVQLLKLRLPKLRSVTALYVKIETIVLYLPSPVLNIPGVL